MAHEIQNVSHEKRNIILKNHKGLEENYENNDSK